MKRIYLLALYTLVLTAFCIAALQGWIDERRMLRDEDTRASALLMGIEDSVRTHLETGRAWRVDQLVRRLKTQESVQALVLCSTTSQRAFPVGPEARRFEPLCDPAAKAPSGVRLYERKIGDDAKLLLALTSPDARTRWLETFGRSLILTLFVGIAGLLLIATQLRTWFRRLLIAFYQNLRAILTGRTAPGSREFGDFANEIENLASKILTLPLGRGRKEAAVPPEEIWLTELRKSLGGNKVSVFANREPYIHRRKGDQIEVLRPASGLVTALEPVVRQCNGLWIGHGSGDADREVTDSNGIIRVPPENPSYQLKRIWLSEEEENGYYYGFSNEGIWPLCHLAHNRPVFRLTDWRQYVSVNQRFCDEAPSSVFAGDSVILVQDYHFALLPRMLRQRSLKSEARPKIGIFWHIPWPNPEAFGICPWSRELLNGMLGADVIGFHTQYHCNNFLETCDRYLEARIDWAAFTVTMDNHVTKVQAFPIGIDTAPVRRISESERTELKKKYGITADLIAVGVDRVDYTKGLLERVQSVERFLEKYPHYIGKFSLVQMGSPSRTHIPAYRLLGEQLEQEVTRINSRFSQPGNSYQPILFLPHHEWKDIQYFYQLGDVCMVTSLHDGMNLVAKEYVWCQSSDRGALILSKFTGASGELTEALLVNPYSIEEMADAIAAALQLPIEERMRRMRSMREKVKNHNAFHWARDLIGTLVTGTPDSKSPGLRVKVPGSEHSRHDFTNYRPL